MTNQTRPFPAIVEEAFIQLRLRIHPGVMALEEDEKWNLATTEATQAIVAAVRQLVEEGMPEYRDNTDSNTLLPEYDDFISVAVNQAIQDYRSNLLAELKKGDLK